VGSRVTPTPPATAAHDIGASISRLTLAPPSPPSEASCHSRRHTQHSSKIGTAAGRLRQDKAGVGERWRETPLAAKCPAAAALPCRRRWRRFPRGCCCSARAAPVATSRRSWKVTARAQPPEGIGGQQEGYSRQQRAASQWPGCCCCCSGARQEGRGAVAHSTWGVMFHRDGEGSKVAAAAAPTSGMAPSRKTAGPGVHMQAAGPRRGATYASSQYRDVLLATVGTSDVRQL
jgi:hypothetical protein